MDSSIIGSEVLRFERLDSTNTHLNELLSREKLIEGTVVITDTQFAGKGQSDHKWESAPGLNLTFSFVLYPEFLHPPKQFMLNKIISLAIKDFIDTKVPAKDTSIKWTNDVYYKNSKIAGIIINNAIQGNKFLHTVVGIGVNINQTEYLSDAPNPISLSMITGKKYDLNNCFSEICKYLDQRYKQLKNKNTEMIDNEYLSSLYRLNKLYDYIYQNKKISAKITGIDEFGMLLLISDKGETLKCHKGDIRFII